MDFEVEQFVLELQVRGHERGNRVVHYDPSKCAAQVQVVNPFPTRQSGLSVGLPRGAVVVARKDVEEIGNNGDVEAGAKETDDGGVEELAAEDRSRSAVVVLRLRLGLPSPEDLSAPS